MTKWEYKVIELSGRDDWVTSSECKIYDPKTGEMDWVGRPVPGEEDEWDMASMPVEDWLNELGNEGWELIKIRGWEDPKEAFYYFKRPL